MVFKVSGVLKLDDSKTRHEIQYNDGVLSGDLPLVIAVKAVAEEYQQLGHHFASYTPKGDFIKDGIAICFILEEICEADSLEFIGDIPQLPYLEGVEY